MRIIISCALLFSVALSSCVVSMSSTPNNVPTFSQTPTTRTNVPSATIATTATLTRNRTTIILTPDDLFALPGLQAFSTPNSGDFCEHLPTPQIVADPNRFSSLSGRFALCIRERIFTAIDLDTGSLVSTDDERGDIVLQSTSARFAEEPEYAMADWNNADIDDAAVLEKYVDHTGANHLSYEHCENILRDKPDSSAIPVEEETIACVKTTEGKIALLRVEKIYPPNTFGGEFSFAILRNE